MQPESYARLAERQKTYWWYRARRRLALTLLRRYGVKEHCRWLDLGCGPGGNFDMLDSMKPEVVAGVDLSPIALQLAKEHAPRAVLERADINEPLPFDDASFDVATLFHVLYHDWVKSEAGVLAEVARILRPGGLLLFTEPAFEALRREMDEGAMTRRRYRIGDFDSWLSAAGFESLFSSYFTSFGVPILLGSKWLRRKAAQEEPLERALDLRPISPQINKGLEALATLEGWAISRGLRIPFGTTFVRVARRLL